MIGSRISIFRTSQYTLNIPRAEIPETSTFGNHVQIFLRTEISVLFKLKEYITSTHIQKL